MEKAKASLNKSPVVFLKKPKKASRTQLAQEQHKLERLEN